MATVSAMLDTCPSLTTRRMTYRPARSIAIDGVTAFGATSAAALPAGRDWTVHAYDSASPSWSLEPEPFRDTVPPKGAVWSGPALAAGAVLTVMTVTTSAALETEPSLTTSCAV